MSKADSDGSPLLRRAQAASTKGEATGKRLALQQVVGIAFVATYVLAFLWGVLPIARTAWPYDAAELITVLGSAFPQLYLLIVGVGLLLKQRWARLPAIVGSGLCALVFGGGLAVAIVYDTGPMPSTIVLGVLTALGLAANVMLLVERK